MKHLILLIDALGYASISSHNTPNLFNLFQKGYFKSIKTLLGYSNAIIPSIFSGMYPAEHNIWGAYKMSPDTSPFKVPSVIPKSIVDRSLLARYLVNRMVFCSAKKRGLLPGHFSLINIPLRLIAYFDLSMKKQIVEPNSMNGTLTLFDLIRQKNISFKYVGYPFIMGSHQILEATEKHLRNHDIVFAYIDEIDHNGHLYGVHSKEFLERLKSFDSLCNEFLQRIIKIHDGIGITAFSDHGMEDVNGTVDLKKALDSTGLEIEKDYIPFLDSTIARFWVLKENARGLLMDTLDGLKEGRLLNGEEIIKYAINFKSNLYGDLFYLAGVGKVILPNFFTILGGTIKAMHGWDPEDETQNSFLFTNKKTKFKDLKDVTQIFHLLREVLNI